MFDLQNMTNNELRNRLNEILNAPPTPRDLEIKEIIAKEKCQYILDKGAFEADPLHWSNNKRRRNGLSVLRGICNKKRQTEFRAFSPTPHVFFIIEDIIEETIGKYCASDKFYEQFVDIKDCKLGERNFK